MQTAYIYDEVPRCASRFTGKERDTDRADLTRRYLGSYYGTPALETTRSGSVHHKLS